MRMFTSESQTAKLIELGFEKPKGLYYPNQEQITDVISASGFPIPAYSIGELIELLPKDGIGDRRLEYDALSWIVDWDFDGGICQTIETELIDALFAMIVKLKERKAI